MSHRFLIIDQSKDYGMHLAMKLSRFADCAVVSEGKDALKLFKKHIDTIPYKAVFMDTGMLHSTGQEDINSMRTMEKEKGVSETDEFKLVMLTDRKDRRDLNTAFLERDADAYIPKHISEEDFELELSKIELN